MFQKINFYSQLHDKNRRRAISTKWRNCGLDRRNLSLVTSTLYDLLNARSDPTRIRSRRYIICNGPYICCSRLVFSSLKLGHEMATPRVLR